MDPIAPLVDALHREGRLRVWSLVITVFGDLVQHRGGEISTARLGLLLGRVGVELGALRTALSRLGRDGWVERQRQGRASQYRLSRQGLDRFAPATSRIYAAPRRRPVDRWSAVLRLGPDGAPQVSVMPAEDAPETADLRVTGRLDRVSEAWRAQALSPPHRQALEALARDLAVLATPVAAPLDAAAARMLLIYRWRRIVLAHPEIPAELMPRDAPLADPRAAVAQVYAGLTSAAERWLDSDRDGLDPMPQSDTPGFNRFASGEKA